MASSIEHIIIALFPLNKPVNHVFPAGDFSKSGKVGMSPRSQDFLSKSEKPEKLQTGEDKKVFNVVGVELDNCLMGILCELSR